MGPDTSEQNVRLHDNIAGSADGASDTRLGMGGVELQINRRHLGRRPQQDIGRLLYTLRVVSAHQVAESGGGPPSRGKIGEDAAKNSWGQVRGCTRVLLHVVISCVFCDAVDGSIRSKPNGPDIFVRWYQRV